MNSISYLWCICVSPLGIEWKQRCSDSISGVQNFDNIAKSVIDELVRMTPSRDGYAAYDESANGITVYGMASCWKTLDHDSCASCLASAAISAFACFPSAEGRVLNAGCFLRYSDYKFVNDPKWLAARG